VGVEDQRGGGAQDADASHELEVLLGVDLEVGDARDDLAVTGPISLSDVLRQVAKLHPDTRLMAVLDTCSILLGDRPVATEDPDELMVPPGSELQFLPPFAGG